MCVSSLLNILCLRRERDPDGLTISGLAFSSSVKCLTVILWIQTRAIRVLSTSPLPPTGCVKVEALCSQLTRNCIIGEPESFEFKQKKFSTWLELTCPDFCLLFPKVKMIPIGRQGTWWVLMGGFQVCLAFLKLLRKNKKHYLEWNQFPGRGRKKAENLLLKKEIEPRWKKAFSHLLARCSVHINVSS